MKLILILLFPILAITNVYAQYRNESKLFLEDYFSKYTNSRIIYSNMDKSLVKNLEEYIIERNNALSRENDSSSQNNTIFTPNEIDIIVEQLNEKINRNSIKVRNIKYKYIKPKRLDKIFSNKDKGWKYYNLKYGTYLNYYSNPIFLRQGTLCLFYSGSLCGTFCGSGGFSLYSKENGEWKHKEMIYFWIS